MNERIKELLVEADIKFDRDINEIEVCVMLPSDLEKFAELIVRDCIKELRYEVLDTQECREDKSTDYKVGYEDGMFDASETIKQHFGVEE